VAPASLPAITISYRVLQPRLAIVPTRRGRPQAANILVVDDDADFRWLLLTLLEADPRLRVTGEAGEMVRPPWTPCARSPEPRGYRSDHAPS
jgi:hypothetical protein